MCFTKKNATCRTSIMIRLFLILLISFTGFSCNKKDADFAFATLNDLKNQPTSLAQIAAQQLTVVYFLGTDCSICQQYSLTLTQLFESNPKVKMIAVVPGSLTSDMFTFKEKYRLPFDLYADTYYQLTKALKANTTPQCFLIKNSKILYSGKIDDFAVAAGITRQQVREHYLQDAINAALNDQPILITKTKPAGCFIEIPNE